MSSPFKSYLDAGIGLVPASLRQGSRWPDGDKRKPGRETNPEELTGDIILARLFDSPFMVIDVDGDGVDITGPVSVKTPRGRHVYYRARPLPDGYRFKQELQKHVEVKKGRITEVGRVSSAGFITAAGSVRDGFRYELEGEIIDAPLIPEELFLRCIEPAPVLSHTDDAPMELQVVKELLTQLDPDLYRDGGSQDFFKLMAAVHHATGGSDDGLKLLLDFYGGQPPGSLTRRYPSLKIYAGVTGRSLSYLAERELKNLKMTPLRPYTELVNNWPYDLSGAQAVDLLNCYIKFVSSEEKRPILIRSEQGWTFHSTEHVATMFKPYTFSVSEGGAKPAFSLWLASSARSECARARNFYGKMTYDSDFDTWTGFAVEPIQGDVSPVLNIIKQSLCSGIPEQYDYMIKWLARTVQYPGEKLGVALLLRGTHGTGKSVIAGLMQEIFGESGAITLESSRGCSSFNKDIPGKAIVVLTEFSLPRTDSKAGESALKSLITEEGMTSEGKCADRKQSTNCANVILTMNNDALFNVAPTERRYFMPDMCDAFAQTEAGEEMFDEFFNWKANKGASKFLFYLLSDVETNGWKQRRIPYSASYARFKGDTAPPPEKDPMAKVKEEIMKHGTVGGAEAWDERGAPRVLRPSDFHRSSGNPGLPKDSIASFVKGVYVGEAVNSPALKHSEEREIPGIIVLLPPKRYTLEFLSTR